MVLPLGFRPRNDQERMRVAALFGLAPRRVALTFQDDGWTAACLRIAGHVPVWACEASPARCARVLSRLGLPGLEGGPADLSLAADLLPVARSNACGADVADATDAATAPLAAADPPRPLVTILICTYNRAALLPQALDSAAAQSWPCEVLVIDDGSTDGTPDVLAARDDVRSVRLTPNGGKAVALARGLAEARGHAILVLDDDDLLPPGAVHALAPALFACPDAVAAWGDTIVFEGASGRPLSYHAACRVPPPFQYRAVLQQIPAMPGATLVRTSAWRALGAGDPSLVRGQDMDLFLRLAAAGPIRTLPLPVFRYRRHDGLRGDARGQWRTSEREVHDTRFRAFVQPVFAQRHREASPVLDRADGHAWAVGLHLRGLSDAARAELERWPAPWSAAEVWARGTVGMPSDRQRAQDGQLRPLTGSVLVVVDDGDEGALQDALARHARPDDELFVTLEVPRDPLGDVRLHWPGTYGARERLHRWVAASGPWRVALASSPEWTPPLLEDASLLPDLPAPDALRALAAALGWPDPGRARCGLSETDPPLVRAVRQARTALRDGRPDVAVRLLQPVMKALPDWRAGWSFTAEALAALEAAGAGR
jgi:GT2 family glycosyltransferase